MPSLRDMTEHVTQDDIIYFVVTDRFFGTNKRMVEPSDTTIHGGTLDGIVTKLDYLSELGVTTIWVTPGCLQTMNCLAHGLKYPIGYIPATKRYAH